MGHATKHFDFAVKGFDKKKAEAYIDDYVRHASDSGSLYFPIKYIDRVFDSYQDASDYIESIATHDYDELAVKYKDYKKTEPSKKYIAAQEKVREAHNKYYALADAFHFADHTSEYIGCKNCGSKISRKYLRSNYCPVCRTDMRPASTLSRLNSLNAAWDKAVNDLKAIERSEDAKKPYEEHWLIRIEYHV